MMKKNTVLLLCAIFIIAFTVRLAAYMVLTGSLDDPPVPKTDAVEYDRLAKNIVNGLGFRYSAECPPTSFRPPLYPLFLAAIYSLFGENYAIVRIIQFAISASCCLLIWYLALLLTRDNRKTALLASLVSVIYPSMFYHSGFLLTESLYVFFILVSCVALVRLQENQSPVNLIASGVSLALLCLIRSNAIFFPALLFFWALLVFKGFKKAIGIYVSIILIFLLALSPWIIRNYIHFNRLTFISSNGGINFWGSNNPVILGENLERYEAWEGGIIYDVSYLPGTEDLTATWESKDFDQFEVDRRCRQAAFNYLKNNPKDIPKLALNKFKRFWSGKIRNNLLERILFIVLDQGMLVFTVLGFLISLKYKRTPYVLIILFFSVQASALVFFANTRMRIGVAPAIIIFAAIGLEFLMGKMTGRKPEKT